MAKGHVNIKGKDYELVSSRLLRFVADHPSYIHDEEVTINEEKSEVLVKTTISVLDADGKVVLRGVGHAHEEKQSSYINKTSFVENASTSALGRCLAVLGYGGSDTFASADEMPIKMGTKTHPEPYGNMEPAVQVAHANLPDGQQAMNHEMPVGKYKGLTIAAILDQVTDKGEAKGRDYLEWFIGKETDKPDMLRLQEIIRRAMKEIDPDNASSYDA